MSKTKANNDKKEIQTALIKAGLSEPLVKSLSVPHLLNLQLLTIILGRINEITQEIKERDKP